MKPKRTLALLLVLVLCLSLCACGSNDTETGKPDSEQNQMTEPTPVEETSGEETVEEPAMAVADMLENALPIDSHKIYQEAFNNIVRVENEYDGKAVLFGNNVSEIQRDFIIVGDGNTRIKVYLETDDIAALDNSQYVLVAGVVSNISVDNPAHMQFVTMDMPQGYLVQNSETDNELLYNNAKKLFAEANYAGAIFILRQLDGYSDSHELLLEAVCAAAFEATDGEDAWKSVFMKSSPVALTGEEIEEIIVGDWYNSINSYYTYTETGEIKSSDGRNDGRVWFVENDRLIQETEYTRSEKVIYPFYKNAYVFCSPRAYNKVTDDVYTICFLNGPVE